MLLHMCSSDEWNASADHEDYKLDGFAREGFIHCCLERQLSGVLKRYFQNKNDLLLLFIEQEKLNSSINYESGADQDMFPHVYGPINKTAIIKVEKLR